MKEKGKRPVTELCEVDERLEWEEEKGEEEAGEECTCGPVTTGLWVT